MKNQILTALSLILTVALSACSDAEVGTKKRPFTMYFIPSVEAETISRSADDMTTYLSKAVSQALYSKDEGFYIKSAVPTSYIAVVEAFGTKKADFATFNTFSYVLAKDIKKYDIEALLLVLRGHDERTYKAQIIAHKNSGIKSLEDIQGKKFAFTDPASTSGYILPKKLLDDKGIKPSETVFAQKHDNVVTMIYQGQVQAGSTYYSSPEEKMVNGKKEMVIRDARSRVKTQFPDVEDKVRIIGFSEDVPNEPWVIRTQLFKDEEKNQRVKSIIKNAILEYVKTDSGKETLKALATGTGLASVTDQEYDGVRKAILSANLNLEELAAPKKKKEEAKKKM